MRENINIKHMMIVLTLIDVFIFFIFLCLLLSSSASDKTSQEAMTLSNNEVSGEVDVQKEESDEKETEEEKETSTTEKESIAEAIHSETEIVKGKDVKYSKTEEKIISIYRTLIIGQYYLSNGMWFDFEPDGIFNGFLDNESPNTSNGYYEVIVVDGNVLLCVYNPEMTEMVSYTMELKGYNIILQYESAGINIELNNDY